MGTLLNLQSETHHPQICQPTRYQNQSWKDLCKDSRATRTSTATTFFDDYAPKWGADFECALCEFQEKSCSNSATLTSPTRGQSSVGCHWYCEKDGKILTSRFNETVGQLGDSAVDSILSQYFSLNGDTRPPSSASNNDGISNSPVSGSFSESITSTETAEKEQDSTDAHALLLSNSSDAELGVSASTTITTITWRHENGVSKKRGSDKTRPHRVGGKGKRVRASARPWSEEEHRRFEESLELYGRDWEKCAAYIGTRRKALVRSHAQKYLIKLCKLGMPLPKKLAESGTGYTLSGKPLLSDSASAKAYLIKLPCPGEE